MELSIVERHSSALVPAEEQYTRSEVAGLELFEVPVPRHLEHFGKTVLASTLGDRGNPPIVVLGGISANCFVARRPDGSCGWWPALVGEGRAIDPRFFHIIGMDFAADDRGSLAPTTAEQAQVLASALDAIGVETPVTIVGASYGGMVGLALAAEEPERVGRLILLSAAAEPHPSSTAARELQRRVVSLGVLAGRGDEALGIARGMAMLTYRTPDEFEQRFDGGIDDAEPLCCSKPGAYLKARGQAFRSVMSPGRFLSLSASIDRHCVDPAKVETPTLVIGAYSDQLVFADQLKRLAANLRGPAELHLLDSLFGHDMFLKEAERVGLIVGDFLVRQQ